MRGKDSINLFGCVTVFERWAASKNLLVRAGIRNGRIMDQRSRFVRTGALWGILFFMAGCASEYNGFHSQTGEPLLLSRRAYSKETCLQKIQEEGARLGVTFRYIHVRGSLFGQSLLWPFEGGYACEAAIGPEEKPKRIYPLEESPLLAHME